MKNSCLLCKAIAALRRNVSAVCPAGFLQETSGNDHLVSNLPPVRISIESKKQVAPWFYLNGKISGMKWARFKRAIEKNLLTAVLPCSERVSAAGKTKKGELNLHISGIRTFTGDPGFKYANSIRQPDLNFRFTSTLFYGPELVYSNEVHVIEPVTQRLVDATGYNNAVYRSALQKSILDLPEQIRKPEVQERLNRIRTAGA